MNNVLVLGGEGWIGSKIAKYLNCESSSRYLEDSEDAEFEINRFDVDIVINAIGHTGGNNVDQCEDAVTETLFSNSYMPIAIAEACFRTDRKFIHLSSGCIYTPHDYKPIKEEENPDYTKLFYSRSKIYAEKAISWLQAVEHSDMMILRPRIPLDDYVHPKNILTKILSYNKILNVQNSVTYLPEFLRALRHLITIDASGIYNIVLPQPVFYEDLLFKYYDCKGIKPPNYTLITPKEFGKERTNLALSTKKLESTGFKMRSTDECLHECINKYIENEFKNYLEN